MQIETNPLDNVLIINISGRLDAEEPDMFRSKMRQILEQNNANIVIDCSKLEYMDSRGLGALISSLRLAIEKGGDIRIARVLPSVNMLLELTRANKVFKIFKTVDEAADSFRESDHSS